MTRVRTKEPIGQAPRAAAGLAGWRALAAWYVLIPALVVWLHAYGLDSPYRSLAYLNIALVLLLAWKRADAWSRDDYAALTKVCAVPVLLMALHFLGEGEPGNLKEIRHLFVALFVALGLWKFSRIGGAAGPSRQQAISWTVCAIFAYAAIQGVALVFFARPDGTTKNPHYLAQYCMLLLPVTAYLYHFGSTRLRVVTAVSALIMAALLLHTGSRPAWLALFCAALVFAWFQRKTRAWTPLAIAAVVGLLYFSDLAGFARRVDDLIGKIESEERVVIWQEAWALQKQSTARGWLVGHGLDSFKRDFQAYSTYHRAGIDFNAPHNYVLELLYTVGAGGLLAALSLLYAYGRRLLALSLSARYRPLAITMAVVLTAHLLFGSITIPFFTSYNILVLGLIGGMLLALPGQQDPP